MFQGSFFNEFERDPFFGGFPGDHMRRMDDMFANPMFAGPFMAVGPAAVDGRQQVPNAGRQVAPRMPAGPVDMFGGMFGQMNNMMGNMPGMMQGMMQDESQNNPNSQFYSQSSMMTYNSEDGGAPKIYQASSSSHQVPGGVRETRRSVKDSVTGEQKEEIGHSIGDRSHVITRTRNQQTGATDEEHNFVNLSEDEARAFDTEWQQHSAAVPPAVPRAARQHAIDTEHPSYDV